MTGNTPAVFVVGFQKCASTWLHKCLGEVPGICVAERHMTHYYDINYDKGSAWYRARFSSSEPDAMLVDTTVTYALDDAALARIAAAVEEPLFIFMLRDPVKRAFSHYWHEKQKKRIDYAFEEVFSNYDLYSSWVLPGFYHAHLRRAERIVPRARTLVLLAEDINKQPEVEMERVLEFLNVAASCPPSTRAKVNVSANKAIRNPSLWEKTRAQIIRRMPASVRHFGIAAPVDQALKNEYERGMNEETKARLTAVYREDTTLLRTLLGRDLHEWNT
ncbi:MAG: hypothetical protein PWP23_2924 [Candidatus Sumerlaeota bacterium]|nr:hypothetical protein [Candidatus Sumerlaeota bacterium]